MRFFLFSGTLSLVVCSAVAQQTSLNTRLRPVPEATGTVVVGMTGQFSSIVTDTYILQKQVFTGSTDCSSGGGAIQYVAGVSASNTNSISLSATDSVLLNGTPYSDHNGQYLGFQNPDGATLTYLPGNAVCVAGFSSGTKNVPAQYSPAIEVLEGTCTNPKYYFNPGDPVCVRVAGTTGTAGTPWHVDLYGGLPNSCNSYASLPAYPGANVTSETQTYTFILPSSNAAIPAVCLAGNNTTDIRGLWTAAVMDSGNQVRGSQYFRVHDTSPVADMQVYTQVSDNSTLAGQTSFPPTGFIKYQVGVQNNGPDSATNVALTIPINASTTYQSFIQTSGPSMACSGPTSGHILCTRSSFPPDTFANFTMVVSYSGLTGGCTAPCNGPLLSQTSTVTTTATDPNSFNNTAPGDVQVVNNTNVGQFICRSDITVPSSSGSGANVTYNPPANFTTTYTYGGGSTSAPIANGGLFPIGTTFMTFQSIAGSGGCVYDVNVTDGQRPDLTITKSHIGNFVRGQTGYYTITVKNSGGVATLGVVTVTDIVPMGFVPTDIFGTGWTCNISTMSCATSAALPPGASYSPITVRVNLAKYLTGNVTNKAVVSGGGEGITSNDESDDLTIILSPTPQPKADFNGDVRSDVIWRKSTTGEDAMWLMSGSSIISPALLATVSDTNWKMIGAGDFNGDGKADIAWWHALTGQVVVWLMNGTSMSSSGTVATVADTNWKVVGIGDFNNDGKSDLFWRNSATGATAIYFLSGTSMIGAAVPPAVVDLNWSVAGIGDFNADGTSDVFWRNGSTGQNVIWLINNGSAFVTAMTNTVPDTNYKVVGVGDADGDGKSDVFWWNQSTGTVVLWEMNGTAVSNSGVVTTLANTNWHVEGVGDFDGDGKADLMWREVTTGQVVAWLMNGLGLKSAKSVTTVGDLNWSIVAPK